MEFYPRFIKTSLECSLKNVPVAAILGPRQCGKSTLAKQLIKENTEKGKKECLYLDLERPSDLSKLEDPQWFLSKQKGKLICIDEIQRKPELFPLIRSLTDEWNSHGCFIILGSASRELIKQSSESLAGRISYKRLTPFLWNEIKEKHTLEQYFSSGGFPRSLLASKDNSYHWRHDFISTFLERDLLQWKDITPVTMGRLWRMLSHINGQTVNYTTLANSLDISSVSVKNYIELLACTYMVEIIQPWFSNLGKRLVKAPKVYIADSGITSALLGLHSFDEIFNHSVFGAIWEQIVITNLRGWYPNAEICYYRTTNGSEADLVINIDGKIYVIECKASFNPKLTKGNYLAIEDISPKHTFVAIPSNESWPLTNNIDVVSLEKLYKKLSSLNRN